MQVLNLASGELLCCLNKLKRGVSRAFADPISIQTIFQGRMVPNAVPSCDTFFVRDIQEKASNGCHSAFPALECCSEKGKNFSIRKCQSSALERGRISTKSENDQNHVFDNAQYCDTFFVEISATKGDRDLVLFSLIKTVAPKKEKNFSRPNIQILIIFEA